ncbi:Mur ligase domain-containing protein [Persicobacter sp. CCB-QB2]|uniref:Mur ligase domain-containing protein n=1 Tax=Persicobacter sp. CCB-QB2 TaxID=1561025 RepID=UPI00346044B3
MKFMEGQDFHTVYFIGIGGIGMSNLARYFHQRGAKVSGYDKTPSPLTRKLEQEGMPVYYEEDIAHIPQDIKNKKAGTLVVYTPAIPKEHQELVFLKSAGVALFKRSEVLGLLSRNLYTIGVAGTHGKTSTSTMLAHLLHHGGKDTAAFLGGSV